MKYIEVGLRDINPNPEAEGSIQLSFASLTLVDALLKKANEKTGREAFIAGGSVRDTLLGYEPRDIDVFLPLQPDEDKDDEAVYYSEILRNLADPAAQFESVARKQEAQNAFENYDSHELAAYTLVPKEDSPLAYATQIISREGSVEDIVNSFDYDLVKAYFKNGKFFVADTFPEIVKKGRIAVDTLKSKARIDRWRRRTGHKLTVRCLEKMRPVASVTAGANWIVMPQTIPNPPRMELI